MSEHETDLLTLTEILLLATNEKIQADLAERPEWPRKLTNVSTREIYPVRPAEQHQQPAQTRSARPCPACRKWARRRKALRTVRRILVALVLLGAVTAVIWVAGEMW